MQRRENDLPSETVVALRQLAHDLSNSLEMAMQAGYLLSQTTLDTNSTKWTTLMENAVKDAMRINREIRQLSAKRFYGSVSSPP